MLRVAASRVLGVNASLYRDPAIDERYNSQLVDWEDYIVGSYLTTVSILAILLNSLVIYTCFRNWNSLVTSDYYILNLACSDIILPMCAFPLAISSSYRHSWIFGDIGCKLYGFLGFFFGLVSITTLTIMGTTRYISICHPDKESSSANRTAKVILCAYVYSLLWSLAPFTGWGSYTLEAYGTSCTIQWNENKSFVTLMSLFCIMTPSVIIAVSYGLILLKCRKSSRKLSSWGQRLSKNVSRKEGYLIKMTFAMCWGFLMTWMPYAIVSMWTAYGDPTKLPTRKTVMAVLTAKSSTVVNPVIYVLMSKKFQPMLNQIVKSLCRHSICNSASVSLRSSPQCSPSASLRRSLGSHRNSESSTSPKSDPSSPSSVLTTIRIKGDSSSSTGSSNESYV